MRKIATLFIAGATVLAAAAAPVQVCQDKVKKNERAPRVERSVILDRMEAKKALQQNKAAKPSKKSFMQERGTRVVDEAKRQEMLAKRAMKAPAREAAEAELLCDETFACLAAGSEAAPELIELDEDYNIPESIIGETNYGFGGSELYQAGGQLFIAYEGEEYYGELWSPDYVFTPGNYHLTFETRIANNSSSSGTEVVSVLFTDYESTVGSEIEWISDDWTSVEMDFPIYSAAYGVLYFDMYAYLEADILVRNLRLTVEPIAIAPPTVADYTDFVGTGFTANWEPVDDATGYLLSVYTYDPEMGEPDEAVIEDLAVESTSYKVEGLDPSHFYAYDVKATNGTDVSPASDLMTVVTLMAPTNLSATINEELPGFNVAWDEPYNANYYLLQAQRYMKVAQDAEVELANGDFSDVESAGTLTEPEEDPYYFYVSFENMPAWEFGCPAYVEGAAGFLENLFYSLFGYGAYVTSDNYDLSNLVNGEVNLTLNAASGTSTALYVYLLTPNYESGYYEVLDAVETDPLTEEFRDLNITLSGANEECCIYIEAAPQYEYDEEYEEDVQVDGLNAFFRSIKLSGVAAADGFVGCPLGVYESEDANYELVTDLVNGDEFEVSVKPYFLDMDGYVMASGPYSEPYRFAAVVGVENVAAAANGEDVRYFNLQGMPVERPEAGIAIRVAGGKATKVAIR